ncbi:hypothetical protein ACQFYA_02505 [Promicromonospora sp. Marseille-Q5078]
MHDLSLGRLLDLERQGWDALRRSTGGAFYGALMTSAIAWSTACPGRRCTSQTRTAG